MSDHDDEDGPKHDRVPQLDLPIHDGRDPHGRDGGQRDDGPKLREPRLLRPKGLTSPANDRPDPDRERSGNDGPSGGLRASARPPSGGLFARQPPPLRRPSTPDSGHVEPTDERHRAEPPKAPPTRDGTPVEPRPSPDRQTYRDLPEPPRPRFTDETPSQSPAPERARAPEPTQAPERAVPPLPVSSHDVERTSRPVEHPRPERVEPDHQSDTPRRAERPAATPQQPQAQQPQAQRPQNQTADRPRAAETGDADRSAATSRPRQPAQTDAKPTAPTPLRPREGRESPRPVLVTRNEGLVVRSLGKQFKKRPVLRDVSLRVQRGEAVGLLGPNGAGKTTCFYIVTGLIPTDYGEIVLDGTDITNLPMYRRSRLGIGYLPQESSIFRGLTVEQNINAVLELIEKNRERREATLEALLAEFSISHLRRTPAIALSGGERRRLEIARALASQPNFVLLDEPLAGIDPIAVRDIRELVSHLKDRGIGVLITDHNVRETLDLVDRAYILHDGNVLMEGTPDEIVSNQEVRRVYLGDRFSL